MTVKTQHINIVKYQIQNKNWKQLKDIGKSYYGRLQVYTPIESTNILLNGWALYQSLACRLYARTGYYQSGGAFGFRDQLQDTLCFKNIKPEIIKNQIKKHAAHQFIEGDVEHWWHDENDRGIRTKKTKSKWVQTSIVRMLKNPIYTGRVTNKKSEVTDFITGTRKELPEEEWIVVERPEMRIISDELFNRAQELLEQRSNEFKLNNKREKTEYVFSTLIYCKHCGYSFRRIKRKYTADGPEYIRWVCSGRNSMGVNHCPNTTVIDEEELLNAIKIYLKSIIKNKKDFMKAVEKEFEKITKLRENNERSEESLLKKIEKVTVKKQKYMEMFQNEIINIQELKKYTNPLNEDIARLERELKLITSEIKEKDVLEKELSKTINTVDDILNNQTITNAMLKTIIDVIEVDSDSNVEVRLKLLNEIGSTPAVITNFNDINPTVTKSNVST